MHASRFAWLALALVHCGNVADDSTSQDASMDVAVDATIEASQDAPLGCAQTCAGCCTSDGGCVSKIGGEQCGSSGEACTACPDGGWSCKGFCFIGTSLCNAQTCAGCCFNDGTTSTCALGSQNGACGPPGGACEPCDVKHGERCVPTSTGYQCASDAGPKCNGSNCDGCCSGDLCAVGTQDIACGQGGGACADCTWVGNTHCVAGACIVQ